VFCCVIIAKKQSLIPRVLRENFLCGLPFAKPVLLARMMKDWRHSFRLHPPSDFLFKAPAALRFPVNSPTARKVRSKSASRGNSGVVQRCDRFGGCAASRGTPAFGETGLAISAKTNRATGPKKRFPQQARLPRGATKRTRVGLQPHHPMAFGLIHQKPP